MALPFLSPLFFLKNPLLGFHVGQFLMYRATPPFTNFYYIIFKIEKYSFLKYTTVLKIFLGSELIEIIGNFNLSFLECCK